MASGSPRILRPTPRRPFDNNAGVQQPPSPLLTPSNNHELLGAPSSPVSRTQSILNLTSSTLLGIYSSTGYQSDERDEPSTPWGTGAETPTSDQASPLVRKRTTTHPTPASISSVIFSLGLRSMLLFCMGMLYGLLVRHLHDDRQLAPFQVEGIMKPSSDWRYLVFWGVAGVALGSLLPWIDTLWEDTFESSKGLGSARERSVSPDSEEEESNNGVLGADWTPVVRSVGAFVGIAYAIRKLPWTSTLQASLTLALVNPVLWYIIDRSKPGFVLSTAVGATGTALILLSNPDMMPSPATSSKNSTVEHHIPGDGLGLVIGNYISREGIEGGIWILSVLFCSCVCFGNIGRRLALNAGMEKVGVSRGHARGKLNGNGHAPERKGIKRS